MECSTDIVQHPHLVMKDTKRFELKMISKNRGSECKELQEFLNGFILLILSFLCLHKNDACKQCMSKSKSFHSINILKF